MFVQNFAAGPSWVAGTIIAVCGPLSFDVELRDGRVVKCHIDHVRSRTVIPSRDAVAGSNTEEVHGHPVQCPLDPVILLFPVHHQVPHFAGRRALRRTRPLYSVAGHAPS